MTAMIPLAFAIHAQVLPVRTPVAFVCTCDDPLSSRYASKFRDALATSPRYKEVGESAKGADGKTPAYHWEVSVATIIDEGTKTNPLAIAGSVVITYDGIFVTHYVMICGESRIDVCAADILAGVDAAVHSF